jgi:hypothetical protein
VEKKNNLFMNPELNTDKKENEIFLICKDGIGCKVINEEGLPNI